MQCYTYSEWGVLGHAQRATGDGMSWKPQSKSKLTWILFPWPCVSTSTGITTVQVIKCVGGCTEAVSSNISLSSANSSTENEMHKVMPHDILWLDGILKILSDIVL